MMTSKCSIKHLMIALILITALMNVACSRSKIRDSMTVGQKMEIANQLFEDSKYRRASEIYLDIVFERGTRHTPQAQFMLAESYFNMGRYSEAIFEYQELIRMFPENRNISTAYFRVGQAYMNISLIPHYSQEETIAALDAFEEFTDRFPDDERREIAEEHMEEANYRLLQKKFYNGEIYYRLYDYSAALMYFEEVIAAIEQDEIEKMSKYYSARIYLERKDRQNARRMMNSMKDDYPDSSRTNRIERLFTRTFN